MTMDVPDYVNPFGIGAELHKNLAGLPSVHRTSLGREFAAAQEVILRYERFLCALTALVGRTHPTDDVDRALRDLLADTFDMLYVARSLIFDGYSSAPFPLLRRAFELICVFHYAELDPAKALEWASGSRIRHANYRKFIASKGFRDEAEGLRRTYNLQSNHVHSDRTRMVIRRLGEGSSFTLAGTGSPPLLIVAHYLQELLVMWSGISGLAVQHFSAALGVEHKAAVRYDTELDARALAESKELTIRIHNLHVAQNPPHKSR